MSAQSGLRIVSIVLERDAEDGGPVLRVELAPNEYMQIRATPETVRDFTALAQRVLRERVGEIFS